MDKFRIHFVEGSLCLNSLHIFSTLHIETYLASLMSICWSFVDVFFISSFNIPPKFNIQRQLIVHNKLNLFSFHQLRLQSTLSSVVSLPHSFETLQSTYYTTSRGNTTNDNPSSFCHPDYSFLIQSVKEKRILQRPTEIRKQSGLLSNHIQTFQTIHITSSNTVKLFDGIIF